MKQIITIGRQFGSGGREIGKKLAEQLHIAYYDKELLEIAAKESGLDQNFLQNYDETGKNSLLYSLVMGPASRGIPLKGNVSVEVLAEQAQREAVEHAAQNGSSVIVGRCADYILRNEPGLLRVFVLAEESDRIQRICKRDGVGETQAREKIKRMDKARKSFYDYSTDRQWGAATSYDLCINVSKIGTDSAVQQILGYLHSMKA